MIRMGFMSTRMGLLLTRMVTSLILMVSMKLEAITILRTDITQQFPPNNTIFISNDCPSLFHWKSQSSRIGNNLKMIKFIVVLMVVLLQL